MFDQALRSPLRFFFAAAVLAAILCLYPAKVDAPQEAQMLAVQATEPPVQELPVGADLSERTDARSFLHTTLYYAPCGHSVQRRERLPAQLTGMSRELLEKEIASVIPGAQVTGFSAAEVDIFAQRGYPLPAALDAAHGGGRHAPCSAEQERGVACRRTGDGCAGSAGRRYGAAASGVDL